MGWTEDLAYGNFWEKKAIELLDKNKDGKIELTPTNIKFSEYDFKFNQIAYECKADRRASKTRNLAIEYECSGNPSGIQTTEAENYIIFIIHSLTRACCCNIPVKELKELCKNAYKTSAFNGKNKLYLVPIDSIPTEYFLVKQHVFV